MSNNSFMHTLMKIPGIRDIIAAYWIIRRHVFHIYEDTMVEVADDHVAPFDEYKPCLLCQKDEFLHAFITQDKMNVDRCKACNLLQTRPRIKKDIWERWLEEESSRGEQYTENRLTFGYALDEHIKYSSSLWRWRIRKANKKKLEKIIKVIGFKPSSMHDIGCGVGFFLKDARDLFGIKVSGNDLNSYAVNAMNHRYGLDVTLGTVEKDEVKRQLSKVDLITMTDVIEHLYDPLETLQIIYNAMKNDGYLFLTTFHIDCRVAKLNGSNWDMHCWNHISHFSKATLENMVLKAGFKIEYSDFPFSSPECKLLLKK